MSIEASTTMTAEVEVTVGIYDISDSNGDEPPCSIEIDSDGDISISIEGYVIDSDEYELLEKAKELTDDDWDLIATSNLID